jgi:hypothetical protein
MGYLLFVSRARDDITCATAKVDAIVQQRDIRPFVLLLTGLTAAQECLLRDM